MSASKRHVSLCLCALTLLIAVGANEPLSTIKALGSDQALSQCGGPVQLTWQDSVGQTEVAVIDDAGKVVKQFDRQPANTNSVTWYPVNASAGQRLYLVTKDETGATSMSNPMNVASGSSACEIVADPALPSFTLFSGAPVSTGSSSSASPSSVTLSTSNAGGTSSSMTVPTSTITTTSVTTAPTSTFLTTSTTPTASIPTTSASLPINGQNGAPAIFISWTATMFMLLLPLVSLLSMY